jgi:hypothetical protein
VKLAQPRGARIDDPAANYGAQTNPTGGAGGEGGYQPAPAAQAAGGAAAAAAAAAGAPANFGMGNTPFDPQVMFTFVEHN